MGAVVAGSRSRRVLRVDTVVWTARPPPAPAGPLWTLSPAPSAERPALSKTQKTARSGSAGEQRWEQWPELMRRGRGPSRRLHRRASGLHAGAPLHPRCPQEGRRGRGSAGAAVAVPTPSSRRARQAGTGLAGGPPRWLRTGRWDPAGGDGAAAGRSQEAGSLAVEGRAGLVPPSAREHGAPRGGHAPQTRLCRYRALGMPRDLGAGGSAEE